MFDVYIDLCDPSSEGSRLASFLRSMMFAVNVVDLEDVPTSNADMLILAGDLEDAMLHLKALRDDEERGAIPIILVGTPEGLRHRGDGPAFGADAVFERPADPEGLARRIRRLLSDADVQEVSQVGIPPPEVTLQLPHEDDESQVIAKPTDERSPSWRPREPTLRIHEDGTTSGEHPLPTDEVLHDASAERSLSGSSDDVPLSSSDVKSRVAETREEESAQGRKRTGATTGASTGGGSYSTVDSTGTGTGTGSRSESRPGSEVPEPSIPPDQRADLSDWLHEILVTADRRVFPDRSPLGLHFAAANQTPELLVPNELFEGASFDLEEPAFDDPIDAFTFMGSAAPLADAVSNPGVMVQSEEASTNEGSGEHTSPEVPYRMSSAPPRPAAMTPVTVASEQLAMDWFDESTATPLSVDRLEEWPKGDSVLGFPEDDGARRGVLGAGGALRLFWRIAALRITGDLRLELGDQTYRMVLIDGELVTLEGPVALRAMAALHRRGRVVEQPVVESRACEILDAYVESGRMSGFERARAMREGRWGVLGEIIGAARAEFCLEAMSSFDVSEFENQARPFPSRLRPLLVEVAQSVFEVDDVTRMLGGESVGLSLAEGSHASLRQAEISPELVDLIVRLEGQSLKTFLVSAWGETGVAGLLYALVAGDVLIPVRAAERAQGSAEEDANVLRSSLAKTAAMARDGDYFSILGIDQNANSVEVERAYQQRRSEFLSMPLTQVGLDDLENERQNVLTALHEAYEILSVERWRQSYAEALNPGTLGS